MRKTTIALLPLLFATPALAAGGAAPTPAPIVFFDIAGPDAARLKDFYAGNFGWNIDAMNMIKAPNLEGTIRQDPPEKILYIGVVDLDTAMKNVEVSGGKIVTPKIPIPSGTFVLFTDPAGNRMGLVQEK